MAFQTPMVIVGYGERKTGMNDVNGEYLTDEEYLTDDAGETESVLSEAWPVPSDEYIREFEEYLMDLDLRF